MPSEEVLEVQERPHVTTGPRRVQSRLDEDYHELSQALELHAPSF